MTDLDHVQHESGTPFTGARPADGDESRSRTGTQAPLGSFSPTAQDLVAWISTVMDAKDCSIDDAIVEVHGSIAATGSVPEWWAGLGSQVLRLPVRESMRRRSKRERKAAGYSTKEHSRAPNWRAAISMNPGLLWAIVIPVGLSGHSKRVGDLTRHDIQAIENLYRDEADRATDDASRWAGLRECMDPDDTLRGALEAGRLADTDLEFIGQRSADDYILKGEDGDS